MASIKKTTPKKATKSTVGKRDEKTKKTAKLKSQKTAEKKVAVKKTATKKTPAKKVVGTKQTVAPKAKAPKNKTAAGIPENMRDAVLKILDERKAEEIVCINLTGRSSVADYLIIASGRAGRQVSAIADYIREAFMKLGVKQTRIEGQAEGNWVLVDGGDVVIHLFRPEVRRYYDLDSIWNGKPAP